MKPVLSGFKTRLKCIKFGHNISQSECSLKVANCLAYKSYLPHLTGLRDEKRDEAELSLDLLLPGVAEPDLEAEPPGVEVVGPPGVDRANPRKGYSQKCVYRIANCFSFIKLKAEQFLALENIKYQYLLNKIDF